MIEKLPCKECGSLVLPKTLEKTNGKCMPCFKKENPFWPLDPSLFQPLPSEDEAIKIRIKHLEEFNKSLLGILEKEIKAGNTIVETSAGWPKPESIFVMMEKPFMTKNTKLPPGIVFRELNDPHYWKAEFSHEPDFHILACRF